jgi:hypothetical protein
VISWSVGFLGFGLFLTLLQFVGTLVPAPHRPDRATLDTLMCPARTTLVVQWQDLQAATTTARNSPLLPAGATLLGIAFGALIVTFLGTVHCQGAVKTSRRPLVGATFQADVQEGSRTGRCLAVAQCAELCYDHLPILSHKMKATYLDAR